MFQSIPTASSARFQLIFNNALDEYKKRTKNDLTAHPLAAELQLCDCPSAVLTVLQDQIGELEQSRGNDKKLTKWLGPTVNVLYALSATLGEGVGLVNSKILFRSSEVSSLSQVFSPAKAVFAGIGVLLIVSTLLIPSRNHAELKSSKAARDASSSQETLVDLFGRIENFFKRLEAYIEVTPTTEMMDITMKIMVEVLSILSIATKEIKEGKLSQ